MQLEDYNIERINGDIYCSNDKVRIRFFMDADGMNWSGRQYLKGWLDNKESHELSNLIFQNIHLINESI